MWRAFLFRRPRSLRRLRRIESLRERIESCAQRPYLLLLPIDDIAELDVGALQERHFCLDPLDCIAGHAHSLTNPVRRCALCVQLQQLKPNWWFSCIDGQPPGPFPGSPDGAHSASKACFFSPATHI
jgi:hypothetical protein